MILAPVNLAREGRRDMAGINLAQFNNIRAVPPLRGGMGYREAKKARLGAGLKCLYERDKEDIGRVNRTAEFGVLDRPTLCIYR